EKRPVIITDIELDGEKWPIEMTLTKRDVIGFRMLLGRQAFQGRYLIDVDKSFLAEKRKKKKKDK
ncbi:MAG: RimK/LysX family protein, partial [Bdellovibrionales bacterium]|nr:RimK/LysX family protein [Bdellovibrionales bacterium]